jgi:hypothetical protein
MPKSMKAVELGGARLWSPILLAQLRLKHDAASRRAVAGSSRTGMFVGAFLAGCGASNEMNAAQNERYVIAYKQRS